MPYVTVKRQCLRTEDAGQAAEIGLCQPSGAAGCADGLPAGLRGVVNLGNTCFMSTVLHAFMHATPLRDFYLGGGHPHRACRKIHAKPCLSCELVGAMHP